MFMLLKKICWLVIICTLTACNQHKSEVNVACNCDSCFYYLIKEFARNEGAPNVVYYCGSGYHHGVVAKIFQDSVRGRMFIGCGVDQIKTYSIAIPRNLVPGSALFYLHDLNDDSCSFINLAIGNQIYERNKLNPEKLASISGFRLYADSCFREIPEFWLSEEKFEKEAAKRADTVSYYYKK